MKPLTKRIFGDRPGALCVHYNDAGMIKRGHIVRQTAQNTFVVTDGSSEMTATLASTPSEANPLAPGLCTIRAFGGKARGPVITMAYRAENVVVLSGGTGYAEGDILTVQASSMTPSEIVVDTVDGSGAITAASINFTGTYADLPGVSEVSHRRVGITGGTGTGASIGLTFAFDGGPITNPGSGYSVGDRLHFRANGSLRDMDVIVGGVDANGGVTALTINDSGEFTGEIEAIYPMMVNLARIWANRCTTTDEVGYVWKFGDAAFDQLDVEML